MACHQRIWIHRHEVFVVAGDDSQNAHKPTAPGCPDAKRRSRGRVIPAMDGSEWLLVEGSLQECAISFSFSFVLLVDLVDAQNSPLPSQITL